MSRTITARMRPDGTAVELLSDGSERPFPAPPPMREMTDEEIYAAALSDPDAQPWTEEARRHAKPVPRIKTLHRALRLTLEEFASCYHIPLETLQDWEQGRSVPDQTARAYLRVIATQPEMVQRSLQAEAQPVYAKESEKRS